MWYFFYGTLQEPDRLAHHLDLPETQPPVLIPAQISRGKTKNWGLYKALINGAETGVVHGSAYLVTSEEGEDALRYYETAAYEVVRCSIIIESRTVQGLTFRFSRPEKLHG